MNINEIVEKVKDKLNVDEVEEISVRCVLNETVIDIKVGGEWYGVGSEFIIEYLDGIQYDKMASKELEEVAEVLEIDMDTLYSVVYYDLEWLYYEALKQYDRRYINFEYIAHLDEELVLVRCQI